MSHWWPSNIHVTIFFFNRMLIPDIPSDDVTIIIIIITILTIIRSWLNNTKKTNLHRSSPTEENSVVSQLFSCQDVKLVTKNFKTNQIRKPISDFSLKTSSLTPFLKLLLVLLLVSQFNQENIIIISNLGIIVTWEVQPKGIM